MESLIVLFVGQLVVAWFCEQAKLQKAFCMYVYIAEVYTHE